jgi:hypothetical protein
LTALIPALAWNAYVSAAMPHLALQNDGKLLPFAGWVWAWLHPAVYRLPAALTAVVRALDWLQLAGFLVAFVMALRWWREAGQNAVLAACVLFAIMGILLPPLWQEDPFVARLFSPLLMLEFLNGVKAPMAMVLPRIGVQLAKQVLGVFGGAR